MKSKMLGVLLVAAFSSNVAVAGPAGLTVVEKIVSTAGNTAVAMTNSVTGGVTSHGGKVTAIGKVGGDVKNIATGEGATAITRVGSNKGVTAKSDIHAEGAVGGNLTNVASGKNATAETSIGANGH